MPARRPNLTAMLALALSCALLTTFVRPALCQLSADDFSDSVGAISTSSAPDANGNRITDVTISGALGDVSFTLNQKEADAVLGNGMNMDMAALTKLYVSHSQQSLGATEEEWKALGPKINRVQRLRLALRTHGKYGASTGASGDLRKAWKALAALIADKQAGSDDMKTALQTVNDAEVVVKGELQQAQKDLQELLTVKQEAMLVQNGILD